MADKNQGIVTNLENCMTFLPDLVRNEDDSVWQKKFIKEMQTSEVYLQQNEILTRDGTVLGKFRFVSLEDTVKVKPQITVTPIHNNRNLLDLHGYKDLMLTII